MIGDVFLQENEKVEIKPWGHEYVIFRDENVIIKRLHIRLFESTSYHYHSQMRTRLVVLSGQVKCRKGDEIIVLDTFESVIFERGERHSTESISGASTLLEIDSPPLDDDIIRLEDKYGRAK